VSFGAILKRYFPFRYPLKSLWSALKTRQERKRMHLSSMEKVRVFYGHQHVPSLDEVAFGGMVKFQWMQTLYPNAPQKFNTLYMVSSKPPEGAVHIARTAQKMGARLIWNQNGVAYPGWYGWRWKERNRSMAQVLHMADHVFYQSEFCKMAADKFLGPCNKTSEILYNPIDTTKFTPPQKHPTALTLLLAGNQYQYYRLEAACKTLALVRKKHPDAHLIVTGKLNWLPNAKETSRIAQKLVEDLNITDAVTFYGPYSQMEAPDLFRSAHILLHTRYNDPCPTVVIEALACGLPVVYSQSGGTPELVGPQAGIGIPAELNWEIEQPPTPEDLAEATLTIATNHTHYAQEARKQAVSKFDLKPWLLRHQHVFESLLQG